MVCLETKEISDCLVLCIKADVWYKAEFLASKTSETYALVV